MATYKGIVVQRTYQTIVVETEHDRYTQDDIERMIIDEFDPIAYNSESEIEVYDMERV